MNQTSRNRHRKTNRSYRSHRSQRNHRSTNKHKSKGRVQYGGKSKGHRYLRQKAKQGLKKRSRKHTKKHIKKQKQFGGYKNCSLGYAMVSGMKVPAINNVEGSIDFNNTYGRLNVTSGNNCQVNSSGVNHPVLAKHY